MKRCAASARHACHIHVHAACHTSTTPVAPAPQTRATPPDALARHGIRRSRTLTALRSSRAATCFSASPRRTRSPKMANSPRSPRRPQVRRHQAERHALLLFLRRLGLCDFLPHLPPTHMDLAGQSFLLRFPHALVWFELQGATRGECSAFGVRRRQPHTRVSLRSRYPRVARHAGMLLACSGRVASFFKEQPAYQSGMIHP